MFFSFRFVSKRWLSLRELLGWFRESCCGGVLDTNQRASHTYSLQVVDHCSTPIYSEKDETSL